MATRGRGVGGVWPLDKSGICSEHSRYSRRGKRSIKVHTAHADFALKGHMHTCMHQCTPVCVCARARERASERECNLAAIRYNV